MIFIIFIYNDWYYIRPNYYKTIYQKLKRIKGFKHSHLTNQLEGVTQSKPITNTNCHMLIYGTSGSGKTSNLEHYLNQTKTNSFKYAHIQIPKLVQCIVQYVFERLKITV